MIIKEWNDVLFQILFNITTLHLLKYSFIRSLELPSSDGIVPLNILSSVFKNRIHASLTTYYQMHTSSQFFWNLSLNSPNWIVRNFLKFPNSVGIGPVKLFASILKSKTKQWMKDAFHKCNLSHFEYTNDLLR